MTSETRLTIVGLGPGGPGMLTVEADRVLRDAGEVWLRSATYPPMGAIIEAYPDTTFHSFDRLYDALPTYEEVYTAIVDDIDALLSSRGSVVYGVPGSPSVGETTVRLLRERYAESSVRVHLVQGLSELEPGIGTLGLGEAPWLQVLDGEEAALLGSENAVGEVPGVDGVLPWRAPVATAPLLLTKIANRDLASGAKLWLGRYYPDEHEIVVLHPGNGVAMEVRRLPLYELDHRDIRDVRTMVYVPPLDENDNVRTFAGMMQLTRRLRGPGGCPWDREQTHASLKPHLLEETYEVLDALDSDDPEAIAEEFGDLLYQITLHSQLAAEASEFTIEDVIQNIVVKLIGRHPHVFGEAQLETAQDVRHAWEALKQRQKPKRTSVFEGIPRGLPALPQSNLMQKRAASVGFEWPSVSEVLDKVEEEIGELREEIASEQDQERQREELGDLFFALVSVARHLHLDPEEALRRANGKFAARFQWVERSAREDGKTLRDLTPEDLDARWNRAKAELATEEPGA